MSHYSRAHICQCLTRLSTLRRNSVIAICDNRQTTGFQFVQQVITLSNALLQLGLRNGDVVAICAFNSDRYLEWLLAVMFVGAIVAPLNYRWSYEEAKSALLSVSPAMIVMDDSCINWYSELDIDSIKWRVSFCSTPDVMRMPKMLTDEVLRRNVVESMILNYSWAPEGAAIICFTSGTTGRPKGVLISHSALIVQSLAKVAIVGYCDNDVYLHTAPLCHIGGLSSALAMLMVGARHILLPKFEAALAIDAIEQHSVTSLITVPAMMADLISLIRMKNTWKGRESVTKILNGGGSLSAELTKDAANIFSKAKLLSAYGMTETSSSLTFMTLYDGTNGTATQTLQSSGQLESRSFHHPQGVCVGKPAPHIELKICADGPYDTGKILTRGPHLMLRYWDPSKAEKLGDEDWFDTGDMGSRDNSGNLWLAGRTNGLIKSGGENVYPEEAEAILSQHPGVNAVVIVGIPDARLSEMVVACIKLTEGWQWSDSSCEPHGNQLCSEILRNYCRQKKLTGFKVPKLFVLWRKPFSLTSTGKIRRDQVRREAMSHLQSFHRSYL